MPTPVLMLAVEQRRAQTTSRVVAIAAVSWAVALVVASQALQIGFAAVLGFAAIQLVRKAIR